MLETPENFGSYLKHERELRGVSLDEIATATKIHIRFLLALESNDYDQLPGEVFIKGFIRSYGKALGANIDELLTAYDESVGRERREQMEKSFTEIEAADERKKAMKKHSLILAAVVCVASGLLYFIFVGNPAIRQQSQHARVVADPPDVPAVSMSAPVAVSEPEEGERVSAEEPPPAPEAEKISAPEPTLPVVKTPEPVKKQQTRNENQKAQLKPAETQANQSKPTPASVAELKKKAEDPAPVRKPVVKSEPAVKPEPAPVQVAAPPEPRVKPEPERPAAPPEVTAAAQGALGNSSTPDLKPIKLVIHVSENSWFNLTVDKDNSLDFILPAGASKIIRADNAIRVTIGNRRGTQLILNERELDLPDSPDNVIRNFIVSEDSLG